MSAVAGTGLDTYRAPRVLGGWYKGSKGTKQKSISQATGLKACNGPLVSPTPDSRTPLVDLGEPVARLLDARWGADEHGSFPCPIPGHTGTARLVFQNGDLRLGCCTGRWRSLGETFAAEAYRRDVFLKPIEIAVWTRRLANEAGTFHPLDVHVPLPDDLTDRATHARNGFALLIGLRWSDGEHLPIPFSVNFAGAWCRVSHATAQRAIRELLDREVIYVADRLKPEQRARETPLYLPGGRTVAALLGEHPA